MMISGGSFTSAAPQLRRSRLLYSDADTASSTSKVINARRFSRELTPPRASLPKTKSRRQISFFSLVFLRLLSSPQDALSATSIFDKYLKKKKLDPLESYVPAVILTEKQIAELGENLETASPPFADCRSLLRSGPASSLRVNIRAVAQYASDAGNGESAYTEVDNCLRALEELDSLLLRASRNDPEASSIEPMKLRIETALNALNRLLKTVPDDVLNKGKAMAEAYLIPEEDDPQLMKQQQQLESLL